MITTEQRIAPHRGSARHRLWRAAFGLAIGGEGRRGFRRIRTASRRQRAQRFERADCQRAERCLACAGEHHLGPAFANLVEREAERVESRPLKSPASHLRAGRKTRTKHLSAEGTSYLARNRSYYPDLYP
jgi:hypothetical protein